MRGGPALVAFCLGGMACGGTAESDCTRPIDRCFGQPTTITIDSGDPRVVALEVADVDDDGDLDLLALEASELVLFVNDGHGDLSEGWSEPLSTGADRLLLADFDGDDLPEILAMSGQDAYVYVGEGAESPTWVQSLMPASGQAWVALAADAPELILAADGVDALDTFQWDGRPGFPTPTASAAMLEADSDLALADLGRVVSAGELVWVDDTPHALGAGPIEALAVADLDGDGHDDVVTRHAGMVLVSTGDGQGGLRAPTTTPLASGSGEGLRLADLDGDSSPDVIAGGLSLFLNEDGTLAAEARVLGMLAPACFTTGDLDRDGRADLILGHPGRIDILLSVP